MGVLKRISKWSGFSGKTFWDWLELLVVPVALAWAAYYVNFDLQNRSQAAEDRRHKAQLEIESQRAQEVALQTYLDRMTELLIEKNLAATQAHDPVRELARARTLTTLKQLDGRRKGLLLLFLFEAHLISNPVPVIWLAGPVTDVNSPDPPLSQADLSEAQLSGLYLDDVALTRVNLNGATVTHSHLPKAYLIAAHLDGSNLSESTLEHARMGGTHLRTAILVGTNLHAADLWRADLSGADLTEAIWRWLSSSVWRN
jgi:uncharacterized protein YjbI with pentapeptide repeats